MSTVSHSTISTFNVATPARGSISNSVEDGQGTAMLAMTDAFVQKKKKMTMDIKEQEERKTNGNRNNYANMDMVAAAPPQLNGDRRSTESFAAHLNEFVSNDAGDLDAVVQAINADIVSFDENHVKLL